MGSKRIIMHISLANEGDEVLIRIRGIQHTSVTNLVGAVPVYYDLKRVDWEPDFEALEN
jgi:aspartate/methionine/tyrosine aminotransferase